AERGRLGRGLDAGIGSELAEDCRHMAIDRTARQKEPLCDLRVATALADEREDLALASRQPSDVAAGRGSRAAADVANAGRAQTTGDDGSRRAGAEGREHLERFAQRTLAPDVGERESSLVRLPEARPAGRGRRGVAGELERVRTIGRGARRLLDAGTPPPGLEAYDVVCGSDPDGQVERVVR